MLVLAFDTTAAACSVALTRHHGATLSKARTVMHQGHAEALMPMIEEVMKAAGAGYGDLDRIAVTVGPGSFTGVRVGLSTARALGLAANKPVIGLSTFEVLALSVPQAERGADRGILPAIDTKRGEIYLQPFCATGSKAEREAVALAPEQIAAWLGEMRWPAEWRPILVGDAALRVKEVLPQALLSNADPLADPERLAHAAAERDIDPAGPLPLYVLPPKVTLAPHGGRLRP